MSTCPFNTHLLCSTDEMLHSFDEHEMVRFLQDVYNDAGKTVSYVPSTEDEKIAFCKCIMNRLHADRVRANVFLAARADRKKYRDSLSNS